MERRDFVAEGRLEIDPKERYFVFFDGEYLGQLLVDHFDMPEDPGYCDLGGVRVRMEKPGEE